jgi:hypothetical protein
MIGEISKYLPEKEPEPYCTAYSIKDLIKMMLKKCRSLTIELAVWTLILVFTYSLVAPTLSCEIFFEL